MNTFCNSFSCATSEGGNEVVLNFRQRGPKFNEKGDIDGILDDEIISLVMSYRTAKSLSDMIADLLRDEESSPEPVEALPVSSEPQE